MTGNVEIVGCNNNTFFCFKGPSPFTTCILHLNDAHFETPENLPLVIQHYNLIEYYDNYQDTVCCLYQFTRDEQILGGDGALVNVTNIGNNASSSFKYKSSLLTGITSEPGGEGNNAYRFFKNEQISVPLKFVSYTYNYPGKKLYNEHSWR